MKIVRHKCKNLEPGNEQWIETKESTQGSQVQYGSLAEAVRTYEHSTEIKSQKWFWEGIFQANEQFSVPKDYGKCKEAERHQTCGK